MQLIVNKRSPPQKNILRVWSHLPRSKRTQKLHFLAIRAWSSIIPKLNSKAMKLDDKGLLIPHLYTSFICMYIVRRLPSRQIFLFGYCRELLISTVSKSRRGETFHLLLIIKNRLTDCFGTKKISESMSWKILIQIYKIQRWKQFTLSNEIPISVNRHCHILTLLHTTHNLKPIRANDVKS